MRKQCRQLMFVGATLLGWCLFMGQAFAWNPLVISGRCKQSGSRCSGTIGNAGQASGACCDPANGTNATLQCEKSNTCTGGRAYKWADSDLPLKWWFNPNNMPGQEGYAGFSEQQILTIFTNAWDQWTKAACTSFRHTYRGKSTNLISTNDNQSIMWLPSSSQWAQLGAGSSTLAFTRPIPDNTGRLLDSDVVFNPRPGGGGRWSNSFLLATAAHEFGHAIGFAHTGDPNALMYFAARGNVTQVTSDETSAVCTTYPKKGPCTSDSDCGGCLKCTGGSCVDKNISPVRNLCKPCNSPTDCGGANDICVRLEEGNRCVQGCDSNDCCPNGYRCSDVGSGQKMCVPDSGKCPDVSCSADSNCGPGEQCTGGLCKPKPVALGPKTCKSCSSNADCGAGSQCVSFDGKQRCLQNCVADNFCPTGYQCGSTGVGRLCVPENTFCPCTANTDCLTGEACRGGVCRPADCKYGCACTEDSQCSPNHKCLQTQQGGACFQPCGESAGYPNGTNGSACNGQTCAAGTNCYNLGGGNTICMKPCSSAADCASVGGQCFRLGPQAFCLCQDNNQCGSGKACNKSVLGQFGGGACAPTNTGAQCDQGLKCQDAGGISICQPDGSTPGTGKVGDECGATQGCADGLQCLQLQQGAPGVCFEECTSSNACKFGGSCILGSQGSSRRFCGCAPQQAPCTNGQTCKDLNGQGVGVCVGGSANPCGNGTCDSGENCGTCAADCPCGNGKECQNNACVDKPAPNTCGNGRCDTNGETCSNCAQDCGCGTGKTCQNGQCVDAPAAKCGNGTCEPAGGENCETCAADCGCTNNWTCKEKKCTPPSTTTPADGGTTGTDSNPLPCSEDEQVYINGQATCPTPGDGGGCGCSVESTNQSVPVSLLLLFCLGLFLAVRRRD